MKILIVDDTTDSREMLLFLLEKNNFECKSACNGKEALEILHSNEKFDLIISDILMPVMDGYQFCKYVKEDENLQKINFMFYTATYNEKKDEEFSLSLGAQRFIVKPQEPSFLLNVINEIKNELESGIDIKIKKIEIAETEIYKLYSERLVNKLEKRNLDLEKEVKIRQETEEMLRKSEERFFLAIEGSQDGLWDWDIINNCTYFSPRWKEIIGFNDEEFENTFQNWKEHIHQDDKENVLEELNKHLKGLIPFYQVEFRMKCKDDSYKWIQSRGKAIFDDNKQPIRMAGSHTDISFKKKYEAELKEAKERAEESDKLKSAFLANLSHEIRTPMNGILGFTQLLKKSQLSFEDTNEYLNIIETSTKRLLNIINNLIDISKIDTGQVKIYTNEVNVNEIIQYLYSFYKPTVENKGIKFIHKCDLTDSESIIITDSEKLTAILTNLLNNSIKFSFSGTIEFGYKKINNFLEFYVLDNGIGIAKDKQEIIFKSFVQENISLSRNYEGAGLGLSIAKSYIELLGGSVWVESDLGKGAKFYFTLPINC